MDIFVRQRELQYHSVGPTARRALLELCRGEALILLRNVPGRREAPNNPTAITLVGESRSPRFPQVVQLVDYLNLHVAVEINDHS